MAKLVLLVDDNQDLLDLYIDAIPYMSEGELAVLTADNGATGLELLSANIDRLSCAVIDVRMPELDGYQMVRAIRGDPATAHVPLVILTAMAQEKDRFQGMASGADRYLTKPVAPMELIAAIQEAIVFDDAVRVQRLRTMAEKEMA
jgi:CheY-like chemotaxis protein